MVVCLSRNLFLSSELSVLLISVLLVVTSPHLFMISTNVFLLFSAKGLADFLSLADILDSTALCTDNEALLSRTPRSPAHLTPGHPEEEQDDQVDGVDNYTGHQANGNRVNTQRNQTGHRRRATWQEEERPG